jgi:hypothetical protein
MTEPLAASRCGADGVPVFVEVGAPTDDELHALLQSIITPLMKLPMQRLAALLSRPRL